MRHLNSETLARLVDEKGDAVEREHLRNCDECAQVLADLRRQTEALASLPEIRPPVGDWAELDKRLRGEGLIREGSRPAGRPPKPMGQSGWIRVAAAIALFLAGSGFGAFLTRGAPEEPAEASTAASTSVPPGSPEEARELVRVAEERYVDALVAYREFIGGGDDDGARMTSPANRFAALERLMAASQAAIREAPADPFLNGILATTKAERQATLRQISGGSDDDWY